MASENIKSANEVVTAFLDRMERRTDLETKTIAAVKALREEGKLTKTNLLRRLEADRPSVAQANSGEQVSR